MEISDGILRVNGLKVVWNSGKWRPRVVGFSGITIGIMCGESGVLGGCFGCLETLGSGGAALAKKAVRYPKGGGPKVW